MNSGGGGGGDPFLWNLKCVIQFNKEAVPHHESVSRALKMWALLTSCPGDGQPGPGPSGVSLVGRAHAVASAASTPHPSPLARKPGEPQLKWGGWWCAWQGVNSMLGSTHLKRSGRISGGTRGPTGPLLHLHWRGLLQTDGMQF